MKAILDFLGEQESGVQTGDSFSLAHIEQRLQVSFMHQAPCCKRDYDNLSEALIPHSEGL